MSDLFNDIVLDINHKLAGLLPPKAVHHRQLHSDRKFNVPVCKTDRLKKSFVYFLNSRVPKGNVFN